MQERIIILCEKCHRSLRVRVSYLGQRVECNYCGHHFIARRNEDVGAAVSTFAQPAPVHEPPGTANRDQEVELLQGELARLKAEHDDIAAKFLKVNNQRVALLLRVKSLEDELSQTLEHVRLAQDELDSRQVSQGELDRLRVEAAALQERANHALNLEKELRERTSHARELEDALAERTTHALKIEEELERLAHQSERRQSEFNELATVNSQLKAEVETLKEEQSRAHREAIERLDDEVIALRATLQAQTIENEEKLARLAQERDQAVSEGDRLQRESELLGTGLRTAREEIQGLANGLAEIAVDNARLEEEREAVARLRSELQTLIKERKDALEERFTEVTDTCERLEHERSALQARCERERDERLGEVQKLVLELGTVRSERDDLVQTLQTLRGELEGLRKRQPGETDGQPTRERELRTEVERIQREAELAKYELADERDRLAALQRAHDLLLARQNEKEAESRCAVERDRGEIARLSQELDKAIQDGEAKTAWITELTRVIDMLTVERQEKPCARDASTELPPRPQLGPEQDQDAFRIVLEEWVNQAQRRRDQSSADLSALDAELQAAHSQLQLLHRDLALGDWGEEDESIAFPFEGE